ncbi:hypothetical protein GCM10009801_67000 [Streptomyces albiaxialis]|uniref:Uncharacterized protein n=1 Tax=Streptomyces albiaxialis TaxID=329523 RepID=A0ABN2WQ44_9ACTN
MPGETFLSPRRVVVGNVEYDETESRPRTPRWVAWARWILMAIAVASMAAAFVLAMTE